MCHGGITVGDKEFTYSMYYEPPKYRTVIFDGDKVHTFYWEGFIDSYRKLLLDEMKKIGWVDKDAY